MQWAQQGGLTQGPSDSPGEELGFKDQRNRTGGSSWGCHPGQGSRGTEPCSCCTHSSLGTDLLVGHLHVPFIYWDVSVTLLSGWAFPASPTLLSLSSLSWFILSRTHIYNQTTQQLGSILVTWKPEGDINTWRSHILLFSLRTHKFYWSIIWK